MISRVLDEKAAHGKRDQKPNPTGADRTDRHEQPSEDLDPYESPALGRAIDGLE